MEEKIVYIDPVCRMKVNRPEEKDLQLFSTAYDGKLYYFCSPFCTATFLDNPERYVYNGDTNANDSKRNSL